jgi:hypothetical protein
VGDTYVLACKYAPIFPACNEFVKFCTRRMRVSGRNNWDILNFAVRGGELVCLVYLVRLVCLVYLVRRTRETRQTCAPDKPPRFVVRPDNSTFTI